MDVVGLVKRVLRWSWKIVLGVRAILSFGFFLIVLVIVLASFAPDVPRVPDGAALIFAPEGALVDELSGDAIDRALAEARGVPMRETLLRDLIEVLRKAKDDDRIEMLVLRLDDLGAAGLSKLQALADEILEFKAGGKPVVAIGDSYTRNQYYLAAHADDVYMHPMGFVYIDGYSRFLPYYRAAIEKLRMDVHVWRVGEYKSFVEPILRDDMSPEDRESAEQYLGATWAAYQADVTAARSLPPDALQRYAENAVALLEQAGGDSGLLAVEQELVDRLVSRSEADDLIRELLEVDDDESDGYPRVGHAQYLRALEFEDSQPEADELVAVVVASGTILDGEQPPGTVGGESTSALIRDVADNDDVKALVLRVDSPGGSAFASEVVLSELEEFQRSGRPLVVSMGSVAASGGYWISMSADEIWASPTTLTGSIGVGATLPTVPRMLDFLGVHTDGLGTTTLAGQIDLTRELGADVEQLLSQAVQFSYRDFITKVAEHRGRSVADIDAVARGRVWIAQPALEAGLVDRIGDIDDAIASAAGLAGLAEDEYSVRYVEHELDFAEQLALRLIGRASPLIRALQLRPQFSPAFERLLEIAAEPLKWVDSLNDPRHIYAYCFCGVR